MSSIPAEPQHKIWTRAEVDALAAIGHFDGQRFELIEGELFNKMGQNPPHASSVRRLLVLLSAIFGIDRMFVQMPVEPSDQDAAHSLPEPDLAVAVESATRFRTRHPGAEDVVLIAEVSDTRYHIDTKRKAKLYARAGYKLYLVLDVNQKELLVFESPRDGDYGEVHVLRPGATLNLGEGVLTVADLFPE